MDPSAISPAGIYAKTRSALWLWKNKGAIIMDELLREKAILQEETAHIEEEITKLKARSATMNLRIADIDEKRRRARPPNPIPGKKIG